MTIEVCLFVDLFEIGKLIISVFRAVCLFVGRHKLILDMEINVRLKRGTGLWIAFACNHNMIIAERRGRCPVKHTVCIR